MKVFQRTVALAAALGFLFAPVALAQTPAQPAAPAAPRKLISPFRGDATVEYTAAVTKRTGANIVTTMTLRNTSPGRTLDANSGRTDSRQCCAITSMPCCIQAPGASTSVSTSAPKRHTR